MKITNEQLRQIIKEELEAVLNEATSLSPFSSGTTTLGGGNAKSKQQKDLERDTKASQSQHYDNQEAGEKAAKQDKKVKKQAAKDRAAPRKRIANINELSKFLAKDTRFRIATSLYKDFPSNDTVGFYKALKKIAGISEKDFLKIIEKEAEKYMTKKNITQLQDEDEKKITDSAAIKVKSLIRDAKKKRRNRTFGQRVGDFFSGKGFEQ